MQSKLSPLNTKEQAELLTSGSLALLQPCCFTSCAIEVYLSSGDIEWPDIVVLYVTTRKVGPLGRVRSQISQPTLRISHG
ncbi:hypothetical protein BaRGS_00025680 [Batillaria attramentaria]|uniref:Uncharacterized protein n=1 Tax=Batillaria attramentaria TaxID=370345 RepID=A0ABD0K7Q1_9CAEN